MCYANDNFSCEVIDRHRLPSLIDCLSEFMCIFSFSYILYCLLYIILSGIMNAKVNDNAIKVLIDLLDFGLLKYGPTTKFIFCSDFKDLHVSYDTFPT